MWSVIITDLEVRIHAASSIRDEESLNAQLIHNTDRESDFLHGVAFVEMESPLHGHDIDATKFSEDQFARVTFDSGNGEVRNVLIGKFIGVSYFGS